MLWFEAICIEEEFMILADSGRECEFTQPVASVLLVYLCLTAIVRYIYRVTHHVGPNLQLKPKQKFRFNMRPMYYNTTYVLVSTGGLDQRDVSPCTVFVKSA